MWLCCSGRSNLLSEAVRKESTHPGSLQQIREFHEMSVANQPGYSHKRDWANAAPSLIMRSTYRGPPETGAAQPSFEIQHPHLTDACGSRSSYQQAGPSRRDLRHSNPTNGGRECLLPPVDYGQCRNLPAAPVPRVVVRGFQKAADHNEPYDDPLYHSVDYK
jgi:hypothetical protein